MAWLYGSAALVGFLALVAWTMVHALKEGEPIDPEQRFGSRGRRLVAAVLGFGLGGLSAEFAALSIPGPLVLVLAIVAAAVMVVVTDRISAGSAGGEA